MAKVLVAVSKVQVAVSLAVTAQSAALVEFLLKLPTVTIVAGTGTAFATPTPVMPTSAAKVSIFFILFPQILVGIDSDCPARPR
jgi:hypothetical protein